MSIQIKPHRLFNKALWEGGVRINEDRVFRSFYTKYDRRQVHQLISKDGSYETEIWQGEHLIKKITKKITGNSISKDIWNNLEHTGKKVDTLILSPTTYMIREIEKTGLKTLSENGVIKKYTKGKPLEYYFETLNIKKQGEGYAPVFGNESLNDEFQKGFNA